jgi:hypothetical protein
MDILKIIEDSQELFTSQDPRDRNVAYSRITQSVNVLDQETLSVILEFLKNKKEDEEALKLLIEILQKNPSLVDRFLAGLVEKSLPSLEFIYKIICCIRADSLDQFSTGLSLLLKNEWNSEYLKWIFMIIAKAPSVIYFPLLTNYFPVNLKLTSTSADLNSLLKEAFVAISHQNLSLVFGFLMEKLESLSSFARQDALLFMQDVVDESVWKRVFFLALKSSIEDPQANLDVLSVWISKSKDHKEEMIKYLENEIKSSLLLENASLAPKLPHLIKILRSFIHSVDGLVNFCLSNIHNSPPKSKILINNKTVLLSLLCISHGEPRKLTDLDSKLKEYIVNLESSQEDDLNFKLSMHEAYSRQFPLSLEMMTFCLREADLFIASSKDEKVKAFTELIVNSIIQSNPVLAVQVFNEIPLNSLSRIFYELQGKVLLENAIEERKIDRALEIIKVYKGPVSGLVCKSYLFETEEGDLSAELVKHLVYFVRFADQPPNTSSLVKSWLVFYARPEELVEISTFPRDYPHALFSLYNKTETNDPIDTEQFSKALILKGDPRGYELFNTLDSFDYDLDVELLKRANFILHPVFEQKFISHVEIIVKKENVCKWIKIFKNLSDFNLIPKEKLEEIINLSPLIHIELLELLIKVGYVPTCSSSDIFKKIDIKALDMKSRLLLLDFFQALIVNNSLVQNIKRITQLLLDDPKYLVRQAASKTLLMATQIPATPPSSGCC